MSKIITIYFVFASFFLIASEDVSNLISTLQTIPKHDLYEIKKLFQILFKEGEFAYTLYSDKPMSMSDHLLNEVEQFNFIDLLSLKENCLNIFSHNNEPHRHFLERWKTWKKYCELFPFKNFCLIEGKIFNQHRVFFINLQSFHEVVNKHITFFKKAMNMDIDSEKLFTELIHNEKDILDLLCNRTDLLGILLGYGRHNARLYHIREELEELIYFQQLLLIETTEERKKLEKIQSRLKSFHDHDSFIIASTNRVMFAADPNHLETRYLREKYDRINRKIDAIYETDDWFEQTLIQLSK